MAPVGGGGGGRGRRKEGRADQPAGWWISLWGFPTLALSPAAAAAATTATAAAADINLEIFRGSFYLMRFV